MLAHNAYVCILKEDMTDMKKNSKIKYFGVAAAALLAVAPVAAPAVTAGITGDQSVATVQAATTNIDGTYAVKADATSNFVTGEKYYSSSDLSTSTGTLKNAAQTIQQIVISNGRITAYGIKSTSSTVWVNANVAQTGTAPKLTLTGTFYNTNEDFGKVGAAATEVTLNVNNNGNYGLISSISAKIAGNVQTSTGLTVSDISTATPTAALTESTDVDPLQVANAKSSTAQVYSDIATSKAISGTTISNTGNTAVIGFVYNNTTTKTPVAYKIADGQYVKASDVTIAVRTTTAVIQKGTVTTNKQAVVYNYGNNTNYIKTLTPTDTRIAKNQTINYTTVIEDANGKIYAYGDADGQYVLATDVGQTSTSTDLTIAVVPSGAIKVNSAKKAVTVYSDAATTNDSGSKLSTDYSEWAVTKTAKDADGNVVAYDLGNNQWVKASAVTTGTTDTTDLSLVNLPKKSAMYSDYKALQIYSDAEATEKNGTLSTSYNEWDASRVSKDGNGTAFSYELGKNQWVKAADLLSVYPLSGTFIATAGTPLFNRNGTQTGSIAASGSYKVFSVTWFSGKQFIKLGNDSQWIAANTGDYYPA